LKHTKSVPWETLFPVSEILPIKQGLKLNPHHDTLHVRMSLRDTSNKTRIETKTYQQTNLQSTVSQRYFQ